VQRMALKRLGWSTLQDNRYHLYIEIAGQI
jgi:hypothetical protein